MTASAELTHTLLDELTGESLSLPTASTVKGLIEARIAEADHPRADFRARTLPYELIGGAGEVLAPDQPLPSSGQVTLRCSEAADIRQRRDRWLAAIEANSNATASISATTQLALVERTGSRLLDVERLRAVVAAQRREAAEAAASPAGMRGRIVQPRILAIAGVLSVLALGGGWWLLAKGDGNTEPGGDASADGPGSGGGDVDGEILTLPVEAERELALGARDETIFSGSEGWNVTISMSAPAAFNRPGIDSQLELLGPDGQRIGYNDDRHDLAGPVGPGFNGLNSRIDITLPADGEYTVISSDLSGTNAGTYTLTIEDGGPGGDGFQDGDFPVQGFPGTTVVATRGVGPPGPPTQPPPPTVETTGPAE